MKKRNCWTSSVFCFLLSLFSFFFNATNPTSKLTWATKKRMNKDWFPKDFVSTSHWSYFNNHDFSSHSCDSLSATLTGHHHIHRCCCFSLSSLTYLWPHQLADYSVASSELHGMTSCSCCQDWMAAEVCLSSQWRHLFAFFLSTEFLSPWNFFLNPYNFFFFFFSPWDSYLPFKFGWYCSSV